MQVYEVISFSLKCDKRTMAWKYNSARGQRKQLEGDEETTRIHGKASREILPTFLLTNTPS